MQHQQDTPHARRRPRTRAAAVTASAAALALALGGCSVADQRSGSGASDASGSATDASAGGTVTVMTHDSFTVPEELIAQFEEESGYELTTTAPGDAGTLVNQLILAKGSPTVDAVYGIDNLSAQRVVDEGALASYTSEALPDSARELAVEDRLTPIDQGQVCVNVDHEWFEEQGMDEPQSLADLAEPEYAELFATTNPVTSSPGLAFLAATVAEFGDGEGEGGWQDYWQDLLDGGMKVSPSWSDVYYTDFSGGEGEGEFPLVTSYSSSPAYAPTTGVVAGTCTTQVEYAGVVEGARNPEGAQAFIDFLLSEDVQASLPEGMYMYPVNDSIELPTEWAENAALAEDPIEVDPAQVAAGREDWLQTVTELTESR